MSLRVWGGGSLCPERCFFCEVLLTNAAEMPSFPFKILIESYFFIGSLSINNLGLF